jgi:integrase
MAFPATLMMSFGVNPKVVGEMLEHSTITTTIDIYSHVPLRIAERCRTHFAGRVEKYQDPEKSTPLELRIK